MKADPKADAPAPKSSKKLILIIAIAVVVLGLGGGGAAWFFMQAKPEGTVEKKVEPSGPPQFAVLEPFVVNLQPENGEQYLQIEFTLQVPTPEQAELIKANMPRVRSRVLLLLSGKRASELSTVEGKRQLSTELIATIKQPFAANEKPQEISDVLYTAFIIQ